MKNIYKSTFMLLLGFGLFTACSDDNDSNPTLQKPTTFVLNNSPLADVEIDLAHSSSIELTCSQPDYGFPANTAYTVQYSLNSDMSEYKEFNPVNGAKIEVDAATLAAELTTMQTDKGKTEADFPMNIPVYFRVRANMITTTGSEIEGMEILSNIVSLNNVHLLFSLPPVNAPENLYLVGSFNGWSFDTCLDMVPVYGATNVFWHMVYIDDQGVKFNSAKAWDGGDVGYAGLNSISGDLAGEIVDAGGNIASSNPGWYLMVVTASVVGRDILYDAQFNKPEVWLMGPVVGNSNWSELEDGWVCTVPDKADADFVSPPFVASVPGGDGDGVRAYVKIPGYDWWMSEFMVFDGGIVYRANGDDQDRVAGSVGQCLYLNFTKETGEIKRP